MREQPDSWSLTRAKAEGVAGQTCRTCGRDIKLNERIVYWVGDKGLVVHHEECYDNPTEIRDAFDRGLGR